MYREEREVVAGQEVGKGVFSCVAKSSNGGNVGSSISIRKVGCLEYPILMLQCNC